MNVYFMWTQETFDYILDCYHYYLCWRVFCHYHERLREQSVMVLFVGRHVDFIRTRFRDGMGFVFSFIFLIINRFNTLSPLVME